jgi:enoyl-CoA hydratase
MHHGRRQPEELSVHPDMQTTSEVLHVTMYQQVALITLHRPAVRNALNTTLLDALWEVLPTVDQDPTVRAIVLTGSDPAFCSGLDLAELSESGENARPRQQRDHVSARGVLPPVVTPIVGAINGAAVTAGLEIALNCDVLFASDRARFADTHLRVGVMPGGGLTVLLPRRVGMGKALEMALTGAVVDAQSALLCGLVDRVVPHEELLPTALALAAAMAEMEPETLRYLVETFRQVAGVSEPAGRELERARGHAWRDGTIDTAAVGAAKEAIVRRGSQEHQAPAS